jgi:serine/threonine-protein kinase
MATVHRALDTRLDRTVAVKLLRREVVADPDIAMRFRREALAATVLRHPNIVACLETGTDEGQPYLVMELIEGEDLSARLRRGGRLAPPRRRGSGSTSLALWAWRTSAGSSIAT